MQTQHHHGRRSIYPYTVTGLIIQDDNNLITRKMIDIDDGALIYPPTSSSYLLASRSTLIALPA